MTDHHREPSYPRSPGRVRWLYVIEKGGVVLCLLALMLLIQHVMFAPVLAHAATAEPLGAVFELMLPMIT